MNFGKSWKFCWKSCNSDKDFELLGLLKPELVGTVGLDF